MEMYRVDFDRFVTEKCVKSMFNHPLAKNICSKSWNITVKSGYRFTLLTKIGNKWLIIGYNSLQTSEDGDIIIGNVNYKGTLRMYLEPDLNK